MYPLHFSLLKRMKSRSIGWRDSARWWKRKSRMVGRQNLRAKKAGTCQRNLQENLQFGQIKHCNKIAEISQLREKTTHP